MCITYERKTGQKIACKYKGNFISVVNFDSMIDGYSYVELLFFKSLSPLHHGQSLDSRVLWKRRRSISENVKDENLVSALLGDEYVFEYFHLP